MPAPTWDALLIHVVLVTKAVLKPWLFNPQEPEVMAQAKHKAGKQESQTPAAKCATEQGEEVTEFHRVAAILIWTRLHQLCGRIKWRRCPLTVMH